MKIRSVSVVLLALSLVEGLLLSSCVEINHLRDAQESFSRAAQAENRLKFSGRPDGLLEGAGDWAAASAGYAGALASLQRLEGDSSKKSSLEADGLWGTALTLKALCEWRLQKYPDAVKTAQLADGTYSSQLYPRDRALLRAIPALIMTDQAYAVVLAMESGDAGEGALQKVRGLLTGADGAMERFKRAQGAVEKSHPLQLYLVQAQLAAYDNYREAYGRRHLGDSVPKEDALRKDAQTSLVTLRSLLAATGDQSIAAWWKGKCLLE